MGNYRKYNEGGSVTDPEGGFFKNLFQNLLAGNAGGEGEKGKLASFLQSDTAKGLGALGAGLFERGRAKRQMEAGIEERRRAARDQKRQGIKAYEQNLKALRDRGAVTQQSEDAFQGSKEAAEALLAAGDRRSQEQRGDIVSSLQSGDPRTAASLLSTLDKLGSADDIRRAQALSMKTDADSKRAGMFEREKDFQSALDQMLMNRGAMAADEGRRELLDLNERMEAAGPAATASGIQTGTALATLLKDFKPGNPGDDEDGEDGIKIKAKAGMRYLADQGFKTEGEFDHKTNKKAVIDEEDGKKEAELTGGEIVFNPKQTKDMEKLIEGDNARGLLNFMKELLSKPQFQD